MKALLIVHDNYQEDNHFPIATGYVAAELVNDGVEVETYCMDVYHYTNNQLANKLKKEEYDIIGLGFFAAIGLIIYLGILALFKEFTKEDFYFYLDTLNLRKMGEYIKDEFKKK
jgi:hypothetical protein